MFPLSLESLLVYEVALLVWNFLLFSQLIVHFGCYSHQIWGTETWVLGLDLRDDIFDEQVVCAFGLFGSVLVFESLLVSLATLELLSYFFIVLSCLLVSFLLHNLTTVSIIVTIISILTGLVLIEELVDFAFTDTELHLSFFLFLDSVGELSEIGLLVGVGLSGLLVVWLEVRLRKWSSGRFGHVFWRGKLEN